MAVYGHEGIMGSPFRGNNRLRTLEAGCMGSYVTKFNSLQVNQLI